MGQYHIVVNLDRKEFLHAHDFNEGLKLLEFGRTGGGLMFGLAVLLACSNGRGGGDLSISDTDGIARAIVGRWAGNKIAIIGDYFAGDDIKNMELPGDYYELIQNESDGWVNISHPVFHTIGGTPNDNDKPMYHPISDTFKPLVRKD